MRHAVGLGWPSIAVLCYVVRHDAACATCNESAAACGSVSLLHDRQEPETFEPENSLREPCEGERAAPSLRLSPESGIAMIDDMAVLKQAMEQMDAEDPDMAQAAKDRAAEMLSNARLSFSKIAELIEQRRLLLRPRIVAGIKRMDQPGMLGDAAFRDTGSALRREGQSFRQIAEAIEFSTRPAPRYEDPALTGEPLPPMAAVPPYDMAAVPPYDMAADDMAREWREPAWMKALSFVASVIFFPVRHPIRFLAIALVALLLFYALRGLVSLGQEFSGHFDRVDKAMSSASSFVNERILRRPGEATAQRTPSAPVPSPSTAPPSAPSTAPSAAPAPAASGPAPSANISAAPAPPSSPSPAAPAPPSAAPAGPPVPAPRRDAKGTRPARSAANCEVRDGRRSSSRACAPFDDDRSLHALDDIIPEAMRRRSRMGGPCVAGIGGCYWGGIRY